MAYSIQERARRAHSDRGYLMMWIGADAALAKRFKDGGNFEEMFAHHKDDAEHFGYDKPSEFADAPDFRAVAQRLAKCVQEASRFQHYSFPGTRTFHAGGYEKCTEASCREASAALRDFERAKGGKP